MTGFEPRTSGTGSNRSANWATTTSNVIQVVSPLNMAMIGPGSVGRDLILS